MALTVNAERLWQRLMSMAEIGATPAGGCNRQALSDEDVQGRQLFTRWCQDAGMQVRFDVVGNLFARREGKQGRAPVVMTGSHLDTQPSGGKFDGVYGVLAGLEAIESLNDAGIVTEHPIEVVVWTNEEGSRFDAAMMGSAVWAGTMDVQAAFDLEDLDGKSVHEELVRTGYMGATQERSDIKAAFELHIEQGPILEGERHEIGVVTGVQHMCRYRVFVRGQETHAGPSPMAMRRDPMMAVAEIFPEIYAIADAHAPDSRVTIGYVHASPGSPNTVPGEVSFTLDMRHPDEESYTAMQVAFEAHVSRVCARLSLDVQCDRVWRAPGVTFDQDCVQAVSDAVEAFGYPAMRMTSGAGHDACNVSAVAPISMIFIPCKDGLSHNEAESIEPEQAEAGANILLNAMLKAAGE